VKILTPVRRQLFFFFVSQEENLVGKWRPLAFMAASNLDNGDEVGNAIARHNKDAMKPEEEIVRETSIKECGALNEDDYRRYGKFLVDAKEITTKQLSAFLKQLMHRRWAHHHVYSPNGLVPEAKSMQQVPLIFVLLTLFQEQRKW
jgi:hypothetical protein